jgi:hypothetical protein
MRTLETTLSAWTITAERAEVETLTANRMTQSELRLGKCAFGRPARRWTQARDHCLGLRIDSCGGKQIGLQASSKLAVEEQPVTRPEASQRAVFVPSPE